MNFLMSSLSPFTLSVFTGGFSVFHLLALPQAAFLPYWVNLMLDKREPTGSVLGEG